MHYHLMCGIWVDLKFLAEDAHRRERVLGAQLARDDRFFGGVNDLLIQRYARAKMDSERDHSRVLITHSTAWLVSLFLPATSLPVLRPASRRPWRECGYLL